MKKLVIIDGNGLLYRAYHAMPSLTDKNGEPVQAVYGFFSMLLNIFIEQRPDYFVACFDRSAPTIRQSLYAGYHAHRPEIPSDFGEQIRKVDMALEKMKMPIYAVEGYEADDVIGTISRLVTSDKRQVTRKDTDGHSGEQSEARIPMNAVDPGPASQRGEQARMTNKEDIETIIVTGDRDLLQLVDAHTKVLMPITGLSKTQLFDEEKVKEKYGVTPEQFVDYKALIGDASDGYPGVSGIGPKTAASLIQKYDTFENLYHHLGELSERIATQLATDAEQAALAQKLARIVRDVPLQFNLMDCDCQHLDIDALIEVFEGFGFKTLLKRLKETFPNHVGRSKEQMKLL